MEKSIHSGLPVGVAAASKARMPHWAISQPNTPPAEESIRLSTSNWRTDAPASGAEGGADGDFAGTTEGAGEQQIGDVGAGDQEDESNSAEEGEEDQAQAVRRGHFVEALGEEPGIAIGVGKLGGQAAGEGGHLSARGVDRGAWGEAAEELKVAIAEVFGGGREGHGLPELSLRAER